MTLVSKILHKDICRLSIICTIEMLRWGLFSSKACYRVPSTLALSGPQKASSSTPWRKPEWDNEVSGQRELRESSSFISGNIFLSNPEALHHLNVRIECLPWGAWHQTNQKLKALLALMKVTRCQIPHFKICFG